MVNLDLAGTGVHKVRTAEQESRLHRFGTPESVDIHCHCLPGRDDGPATMQEALALCQALCADGITTAIATPHQLGRYGIRNSARAVAETVATLQSELDAAGVPLQVMGGGDVRVDERLVPLLEAGEVCGLGPTGHYVLLELPEQAFVDVRMLVSWLEKAGRRAILSHPERHPYLVQRPAAVLPWLEMGLALQVTAGSLLGAFGTFAEQAAWKWLSAGQVALIASDAHDVRRRPPSMQPALAAIERRLGPEVARAVCIDNPLRVLRGESLPVFQGSAATDVQPRDRSKS